MSAMCLVDGIKPDLKIFLDMRFHLLSEGHRPSLFLQRKCSPNSWNLRKYIVQWSKKSKLSLTQNVMQYCMIWTLLLQCKVCSIYKWFQENLQNNIYCLTWHMQTQQSNSTSHREYLSFNIPVPYIHLYMYIFYATLHRRETFEESEQMYISTKNSNIW